MVICSGSTDEGESNFAWSHIMNLSNGDYAEYILPDMSVSKVLPRWSIKSVCVCVCVCAL